MAIAALITWLVTAGFGSFMVFRWRSNGGLSRGGSTATHFPPARVFTHLGLAVAGLVVWIIYLVTDAGLWAWIAVIDLVLVAVLGSLLARQWAKDGRAAMAGQAAPVDLAEQHIPRPPVVVHGVFAVSTLVLVLLTALGVGES
jgi:predicted lysophospholipase L1 biosynthesis ABC-type transport system permease subunit